MIRCVRLLLPVFILQLSACATTADLSGFSTQTTSLVNSVSAEQQEVEEKMSEVIALSKLAKEEGWFAEPVFPSEDGTAEQDVADLANTFDVAKYSSIRKEFIKQSNDIQGALEAITVYSTSLAELAAAGETGASAVQKSVGALNGISSSLRGPATLIGGEAMGVLSHIADLVTRAQAQKKIKDAMGILAGKEGALRKTVDLLSQVLDVMENNFVTPIYMQINALERYRFGPGMISFYQNTSTWMYRNRAFYLLNMEDAAREEFIEDTTEQEMFEGLSACLNDTRGCPTASLASGLAARLVLIDTIEKDYRAFQDAKDRNEKWHNKRVATIAQTKKTLVLWADQHDAIYNSIATCGGFSALKPGCGNWTDANFKSATEKLRRGIGSAAMTNQGVSP